MVRANINIIIKDGKYSFQSTNGHNYVVIGEIAELVGSLCTLNDSVNEFYGNIDSEALGNFVLNLELRIGQYKQVDVVYDIDLVQQLIVIYRGKKGEKLYEISFNKLVTSINKSLVYNTDEINKIKTLNV
jgi:hypothetical protein